VVVKLVGDPPGSLYPFATLEPGCVAHAGVAVFAGALGGLGRSGPGAVGAWGGRGLVRSAAWYGRRPGAVGGLVRPAAWILPPTHRGGGIELMSAGEAQLRRDSAPTPPRRFRVTRGPRGGTSSSSTLDPQALDSTPWAGAREKPRDGTGQAAPSRRRIGSPPHRLGAASARRRISSPPHRLGAATIGS
jgi:hypothetical protein